MITAVLLAVQQKPLLQELIPHPTGTNGYEEFLRAVDLFNSDERYRKAYQTLTTAPDGDWLAARRAGLEIVGPILSLMRAGAAKPLTYPVGPTGVAPRLLFAFQKTTRVMLAAAYVELAEGKSSDATRDLLIPLQVYKPMPLHEGMMGAFEATSVHAQIFSILNHSFDSFSPADLVRLEAAANTEVERPLWAGAIPLEARLSQALIRAEGEQEETRKPSADFDTGDRDLQEYFKQTDAERALLRRNASLLLEERIPQRLAISKSAEGNWLPFDLERPKTSSKEDLATRVANKFDGGMGVTSLAVNRTKWRLVRLMARLRRVMAEEDRVPTSFPSELSAGYTLDGLPGGQLILRSSSTGFWVESRGVAATGPVSFTSRLPVSKEVEAP